MDKIKYIGLDVHRDTISAAVLNESGRLIQQSVLMTRTAATDFHGDGIHMNSVDTGWVTDEDPIEIAARKGAIEN